MATMKTTLATDTDPKAFSVAIGYDESGSSVELIRNASGIDEVWPCGEGDGWGNGSWEVQDGRWVQV